MEIKNAKITSTFLGYDEHGFFTFSLSLAGDGWGVTVGNFALDGYDPEADERAAHPKSMILISEILNVVGVRKWEDLKGNYIRVESNGLGRGIHKIGNLVEDKWIDFKGFFKQQAAEKNTSNNSSLEKEEELLNEQQKIVLEYLTSETVLTNEAPILSINNFTNQHFFTKLPDKVSKAFKSMSVKENYEVIAAFASWGLTSRINSL